MLLAAAPRGGTRRHLEEGRELLLLRSISSVAAASAPLQQQQQATAVSRDDERSTGAVLLKFDGGFSFESFSVSFLQGLTRGVHPYSIFQLFSLYERFGKSCWVSLTLTLSRPFT